MFIDTHTLIWLFPIAFMFHDFEEILFWEGWLKKNGEEVKRRLPAFLARPADGIVRKTTAQFAFPVLLIFSLTALSSFLAAEFQAYGLFLMASGAFFLHGFMHLGQAIVLRRYVPAAITSAVIVIPFSLVLYGRLLREEIIDLSGLLVYFLLGVILIIPLILVMHKVGDDLYQKISRFLVGEDL